MVILLTAVFLASYGLTWWIRNYCLSRGIVDVPNERSSHTRSVVRGGGIGFSFLFLAVIVVFGIDRILPSGVTIAFAGGGSGVALAGWTDDRKGLSQVSRIILHLLAAAWVFFWLKPALPSSWAWVGELMAVTAFVWMVNLYNFMDGTDGIAAIEAFTVALLAGSLCILAGAAVIGHVYWLLAGAVAGFLVWNWPPARIFMGDAGSGFLGFAFASLTLWCFVYDGRLLWPCLILLSVFLADATTTLLLRMAHGEKWYEPHCSHAYQRLARRFGHRPIALGVLMIDVLLLAPVAWLAWLHPGLGFALMLALNTAFAAIVLVIRNRVD